MLILLFCWSSNAHTFFSFLVTLVDSNGALGSDAEINCELVESGLIIVLPTQGNDNSYSTLL